MLTAAAVSLLLASTAAPTGARADAPSTTPVVTIGGTVAVGQWVWAAEGALSPTDTDYTYQWIEDGNAIADATGDFFQIPADLLGHQLAVQVTRVASAQSANSDPQTVAEGIFYGGPAITGSPLVGRVLTVSSADWSPEPSSVAYQWLSGAVPIPGATGTSYAVNADDIKKSITVTATVSRTGYAITGKTSSPTAAVTANDLVTSAVPRLSTTRPVVGTAVGAQPGEWPDGVSLVYVWRADGREIMGAETASYVPTKANIGKVLSVNVVGYAAGHWTSRTATASSAVAPGTFDVGPLVVTGAPVVGGQLNARTMTGWTPHTGAITVSWKRDGVVVPAVTTSTYHLTRDDLGSTITAEFTGTRDGFVTKVLNSAPTAAVLDAFTSSPAPSIGGSARVGQVLTARTRTWVPAATGKLQWLRDGVTIPGATGRTYRLIGADYLAVITVRDTRSTPGYASVSTISAGTPQVDAPLPTLTEDGMFKVGSKLPAGTYMSAWDTGATCYWERSRASRDGSPDFVAANGGTGKQIVTIAKSDKYFYTRGCGAWTKFIVLGTARTSMADGVYAVGSELKPGTYTTSGGGRGCYWARLTSFAGADPWDSTNPSAVQGAAGSGSGRGKQRVTIKASDKGFQTQSCGNWKRIS